MKRNPGLFYFACLAVPLCFLSWAASINSLKIPTLTVTVSDFTLDYAPAGRTVTIRPNTGGATQTDVSDTDGLVTFNVVTPGLYTLTISDVNVAPLTILVPNQTGTVEAKNIVVSDWTPPSEVTVLSPTDNLRGWSLIPTNALSSSGGESVWTNNGGFIDLIEFSSTVRFNPDASYLRLLNDDGTSYSTAYLYSIAGSYAQLDLVASTNQDGTNITEIIVNARASNGPIIQMINQDAIVFQANPEGTLTLAGTTNQIVFGGTNTAPSVTTNVAKWISVQISGRTNAYRIPLYE